MKKAQEIVEKYISSLKNKIEEEHGIEIKLSTFKAPTEQFFIDKFHNTYTVKVSSTLLPTVALNPLQISLKTNKFNKWRGVSTPLYANRPLWLTCKNFVKVTDHLGFQVPDVFFEKESSKILLFALRILELGFNTIILGTVDSSFDNPVESVPYEETLFFKIFKALNIKVLIKPVFFCSTGLNLFCEDFQVLLSQNLKCLAQKITDVDGYLWCSFYTQATLEIDANKFYKTKEQIILAELKLLENSLLDVNLYFYLPSPNLKSARQLSHFVTNLVNKAQAKTSLVFSFIAGQPTDLGQEINPILEMLQHLPKESGTAVYYIFNTGAISCGEGLWPTIPLDLDSNLSYLLKNQAPIHLTASVPQLGTFLDCALWCAGQRFWKEIPFAQLVKLWFFQIAPTVEFSAYFPIVQQFYPLIIKVHRLKLNQASIENTEVLQRTIYSLLSEIKELEVALGRLQCPEGCNFKEHFKYTLSDLYKLIKKRADFSSIAIPSYLSSDSLGPGFF